MATRGPSGFSDIDKSEEPGWYVEAMDRKAARPGVSEARRRMRELLGAKPGDRVLDVGCGTGEETAELAKLVSPDGSAVGVDRSVTMLAQARQRFASKELPVDFRAGDANQLDFPDNLFDGCRAEAILQYLDDPVRAVAEMARVIRSGASLVVLEPDWLAASFESGHAEFDQAFPRFFSSLVKSAAIGRQLYRLFLQCGLSKAVVDPRVLLRTDLTILEWQIRATNAREEMDRQGTLAKESFDQVMQRFRSGDPFLQSIPSYIVSARKH